MFKGSKWADIFNIQGTLIITNVAVQTLILNFERYLRENSLVVSGSGKFDLK
mgnify:CR=1 FL=1